MCVCLCLPVEEQHLKMAADLQQDTQRLVGDVACFPVIYKCLNYGVIFSQYAVHHLLWNKNGR